MESNSQIVVIRDPQDIHIDDILFVLAVTNYDDDFEKAVRVGQYDFNQQDGEDDVLRRSSLEDCILAAIENAGYDYEFTGFETVNI